MIPGSHRREKVFHSAAIRRPDFGDWAVFGRPFGKFSRHPAMELPRFRGRNRQEPDIGRIGRENRLAGDTGTRKSDAGDETDVVREVLADRF